MFGDVAGKDGADASDEDTSVLWLKYLVFISRSGVSCDVDPGKLCRIQTSRAALSVLNHVRGIMGFLAMKEQI